MIKDDLISTIKSNDFDSLALRVFRAQAQNNKVYKSYLELLDIDPATFGVMPMPITPICPFFVTNIRVATRKCHSVLSLPFRTCRDCAAVGEPGDRNQTVADPKGLSHPFW